MEITKKNKIIAEKLLGWELDEWNMYINHPFKVQSTGQTIPIFISDLKFHSDSNWQWICLEKIGFLEGGCTMARVYWVLQFEYHDEKTIFTKQDLFEAIYNYVIKNEL